MDIRVFTGGHQGAQLNNFMRAFRELRLLPEQYVIDYRSIKDVKDRGWTAKLLVDWLLGGHVHFIISHVHQGYSGQGEHQMGWNMINLMEEMTRLKQHPGFPNGVKIACPVFTQDKIGYLQSIPSFVNPSLKVMLSQEHGHSYEGDALLRYNYH
jgi:hypothetical protein